MADPESEVDSFLRDCGWASATREVLASDASSRTYDRLIHEDGRQTAVLMKTPPQDTQTVRSFVAVTKLLRHYGLSAPEILQEQAAGWLLLIEDLGDALLARVCTNDALESELYSSAVDLLVDLQKHPASGILPSYDMSVYLREARLLTEWYLPAVTGQPVSGEISDQFGCLVSEACEKISQDSTVVVTRDYHAENLFWLPDRSGVSRIGMIDYQDALAGNPAYDLVSLLEDARRDTSEHLRREMFERFLKATGRDRETFSRDYSILGMQRNLKIVGIFARLGLRDGKFAYLEMLPRVWHHLQRDLRHPELQKIRQWVERHVPAPDGYALEKVRVSSNAA